MSAHTTINKTMLAWVRRSARRGWVDEAIVSGTPKLARTIEKMMSLANGFYRLARAAGAGQTPARMGSRIASA
jgi:hypothetical protein